MENKEHFEKILDDNENIYWIGKPLKTPFIITGLPFLFFGIIWFCIDYFGFIQHMDSNMSGFTIPFFILHLMPFWLSVLNIIRLLLVHSNTYYCYTDKRVIMRSGFWGTDFKLIDYDKISDIEVNVNPIENIYTVGTIKFYSGRSNSNGNQITDNFIAIANPYEVLKKIKQISLDVKTDFNYPNDLRPESNRGYNTKYKP